MKNNLKKILISARLVGVYYFIISSETIIFAIKKNMVDLELNHNSILMLYSIFKNAGIRKQESIAILTLLNEDDLDTIFIQIADLMDNNGWILPTEQELMEILWPILKSGNDDL